MKVLLVHPPVCDPTMPYVAVPLLGAALEREGFEVDLLDANMEALDWLLSPERLGELESRLHRRFSRLDRQAALSHPQQLSWLSLYDGLSASAALREGGRMPRRRPAAIRRGPAAGGAGADGGRSGLGEIDEAMALLRGQRGDRFYDPAEYGRAADTVDAGLKLASAAHAPLSMDLRSYRTPFSFLDSAEIRSDASPEHDPFHAWFSGPLCDRIERGSVGLVGISVVFPGQLQPAWSMAWTLRRRFPGLWLVVGGPGLTQRMVHLPDEVARRMLVPFDAAVLFEGEQALVDLVREASAGGKPSGIIQGSPVRDPGVLPLPSFDRLPLARYLSPEPVLPYDASRGCYWGRCAFCHYGPVAHGTATYRERPLEAVVDHLSRLRRLGARIVYLSHDTLSPSLGLRLAGALRQAGADIRWASDLRPEPALTPDWCARVAEGGALAFSLGVESGAERVLKLMDKGIRVDNASQAVRNLAAAGIAAEAMVFLDFPTETAAEAALTLRFLEEHRSFLSLFMCGTFGLTEGSRVARCPGEFGLQPPFHVAGDEFKTALFYEESRPSKTARQREELDLRLESIAARWRLRPYPWAGSLSTAHTLLWVDRFGPGVFREGGPVPPRPAPEPRLKTHHSPDRLRSEALAREREIWTRLVYEQRCVGREPWKKAMTELTSGTGGPTRRRQR